MTPLDPDLLRGLVPDAPHRDWPGYATALVRRGELIGVHCAGLANVEHRIPIGPHTVFRVASITKQFLCAGLIALANEQKLDLNERLSEYVSLLPELHAITLRDAMSNTSGIRDHLELWYMAGGGLQVPHRIDASLALCARQKTTNFKPGSRYLYSNANFLLLSAVAETVAGETLGAFLKRRFFDPLGMTRTQLISGHHDVVDDFATGYVIDQHGALKRGRMTTELSGDGSAVSCLSDLIKWVDYYRRDPQNIIAKMRVPRSLGDGTSPYGLGLFAEKWRGVETLVHTGLWPGYLTEILYAHEEELAVVTLANVNSIEPTLVNRGLLERLFPDLEEEAREVSPAIWQAAQDKGLWINPTTLDVAEFHNGDDGRKLLCTYGFTVQLRVETGDRLTLDFARSDYEAIDLSSAVSGEVVLELANGRSVPLVPAASLNRDRDFEHFAGTWWNDELSAEIVIRRDCQGYQVETPGFRGHDWVAIALKGGVLRIEDHTGPWPRQFFLLLDEEGQKLIVNGPRVRRLEYSRKT